jgi:GDP-4-dehydro-6-deoxy-D-mannose reductase
VIPVKALITGSSGFVAGHLADYLYRSNGEIYGLSWEGGGAGGKFKKVYVADVRDEHKIKEILNEIRPDYVYHLAGVSSVGRSWKNLRETLEVNMFGALSILAGVCELGLPCRVLIVGSAEEYGITGAHPVEEDHPLHPVSPYGLSKMAQELLARQYVSAYGVDAVLVRPFNHIGPGQSPDFVVSDFARQVARIEKGLQEPVLEVGNLDVIRDFTDVRDVVRAYAELMQHGKAGEVYNVCAGSGVSIRAVLDILISLSGREISVRIDERKLRPVENPVLVGSNEKICRAAGWRPQIAMAESLAGVLNHWRKNV